MIHTQPYHPQVQGKVERAHKEFNLIKSRDRGVNWVEQLPNYQRVLNQGAREELGWLNSFQVYYVRYSNFIQNEHIDVCSETDKVASEECPSATALMEKEKQYELNRDKARADRSINKHSRIVFIKMVTMCWFNLQKEVENLLHSG